MQMIRRLRNALAIGLILAPAGAALAQEGEGGEEAPSGGRGAPQQFRLFQRDRLDPEQMEELRRQFGQIQRGMPGNARDLRFEFEPDGVLGDPLQFRWMTGIEGQEGHGFGLVLRPVPEVLRSHLELPEDRGVVVAEVAEDGPAAGTIEPNDILLSLGDSPLAEPADLGKALEEAEGDTLSITLLRGGEEQTVEVERPRPADTEAGALTERFVLGVTIEEPDDAVRSQLGLPEGQGVIVMDVSPDSAAAKAGVTSNDILTKLGDEPITGARALAEQVQANGGEPVALTLLRDGEETTIEVTPEMRPAPPIPGDGPQPPAGMRFFGPGVMIDPANPEQLRQLYRFMPQPGAPGQEGLPRNFMIPGPSSPEMEPRLDEILDQLKQLREEVDALKESRPDRRDRG